MLNFIAIIFAITLLVSLVLIFIFNLDEKIKQGKSIRKTLIALISFLVISVTCGITDTIISEIYLVDPIISCISIEDIYYQPDLTSYVIRDSDNNIYTIRTDDIYKGDKNYIIRYTQPKLTKTISFLINENINEYSLVLTNPENIPKLSAIDK